MKLKSILLGAVATVSFAAGAMAQEVTLRVHQFLPAQAPIPSQAITPWAEAIQDQSDGRIAVELYPAMQLGGAPYASCPRARLCFSAGVVRAAQASTTRAARRSPRTRAAWCPRCTSIGSSPS